MPYIKQEGRSPIMIALEELMDFVSGPGDLNYAISRMVHLYIMEKGLRYVNLNEVIGVLECAKLEAYRCVAAPYEDGKRDQNGPVSVLDAGGLEVKCPECDGSGVGSSVEQTVCPGITHPKCEKCNGTGKAVDDKKEDQDTQEGD